MYANFFRHGFKSKWFKKHCYGAFIFNGCDIGCHCPSIKQYCGCHLDPTQTDTELCSGDVYRGAVQLAWWERSAWQATDTRDAGSIPGSGRSLEKEMAAHSGILAGRIKWTEEPDGLQSMGLQRVGHD